MADIKVYEQGHDGRIVVEVEGVPHVFDTAPEALAFRRSLDRPSAVVEWEAAARVLLTEFEQVIDAMAKPARLWRAGGLLTLVEATQPGAFVGDSTVLRERAMALAAAFAGIQVFLQTPLPQLGLTPLEIISVRD